MNVILKTLYSLLNESPWILCVSFLQETFLQIPVSAIYERPIKLFSEWIEAERYFSNAQ